MKKPINLRRGITIKVTRQYVQLFIGHDGWCKCPSGNMFKYVRNPQGNVNGGMLSNVFDIPDDILPEKYWGLNYKLEGAVNQLGRVSDKQLTNALRGTLR